MYKIRNILLIIFSFIIFQAQLKAEEELGSQHTVGLGFLYDYEYSEPNFMHLRSGQSATADEFANIGLLYNYKNALIKNGYLSEFEVDSSAQFLTQTYWSNSTGTMKAIDTEIYNLRGLYGIQLSKKLMLKSGLGYRYLYHYWQNRVSTTGAVGYDREQDYTYIPIIAELKSSSSTLKIEYDRIIEGNHTAYLSQTGSTDLDLDNNDGYMWKASYEQAYKGFIYEPYYEFISVEDSNASASGSFEPMNTTYEIGFKITKNLNSNRPIASNYKNIIENDKYSFGLKLLRSSIESGFYAPTGGAKIEEEDYGYSFVTGINIIDNLKELPIDIGLEIGFNQFGETRVSGHGGDTVTTDGRYQKGRNSAGTVLSFTGGYNEKIIIRSYSTSIGIKPSYEIINNLVINANLGIHLWEQSEIYSYTKSGNSRLVAAHEGIDTYIGVGINYNMNALSFEFEYLEYEMEYKAKSFNGTLKYNF